MTTMETNEGSPLSTSDIAERMWPFLGEKARKLINADIRNVAIQFDRGEDGKIYQLAPIWAKSTQTRPEQKYTREVKQMITLAKTVRAPDGTKEAPDKWVQRFALLFGKLAEEDKISYGTLGPPVAIPLAKIDVDQRFLLVVYCFSDYEQEELNEWLGNDAFIDEGGIGSEDWSELPK